MILTFKLAFYEIKKLFSVHVVKYAVFIFFSINIALCAFFASSHKADTVPENLIRSVYDLAVSNSSVYFAEYERIESLTFSEAPPAPVYGNSSFSDLTVFSEVNRLLDNDKAYKDRLTSLISDAEGILTTLQNSFSKDSYTKQYQEEIISVYSDLNDSVSVSTEYICGWDIYFSYSYDFIIAVIIILLLTSVLFHEDKSTGFIHICNVSKNGRLHSTASKVIVLFCSCFFLAMLFSGANFILIGLTIGFSDGTVAIQSLPSFYLFPLSLNFLQYAIINFLLKVFAVFFSALIFAVISLFWGSLNYYLTSVLFLVFEFALYQYNSITLGQWKYLNVFSVAHPQGILNRYRSVNIFGSSVDIIDFLICTFSAIAIAAILTIITVYSWTMPKKIRFKFSTRFKIIPPDVTKDYRPTSHSLRLTHYEIYKMKWWVFLAVMFIAVKFVTSSSFFAPIDSSYERMKSEYMFFLEGPWTQEKDDFICGKISEYTDIILQYDSMKLKYWDDTISQAEYSEYIRTYTTAQGEINLLYYLYDHAQFLHKNGTGWFIYDSGISKFITQSTDYLLVICICCFCGMIFTCEFQNKTSEFTAMSIVSVTKNGRRKLFLSKSFVCLISSCLVYIIFFSIDLLSFLRYYNPIPLNAPLSSCQSVPESIWELNFIEYFLLIFLVGLIGVCILSAMFTALSYLLKYLRYILLVIISSVLLPTVLSAVVSNHFDLLNITYISDSSRLLLLSTSIASDFPICLIIIVLLLHTFIATFLMFLALRQIKK